MSDSSTSVIVFGASGRMGARLCALASSDASVRLVAAVVREGSPRDGQVVRDAGDGAMRFISPQKAREIDAFRRGVVIDFSSDEGAAESLALALHHRAAMVVGTTALAPATVAKLRAASSRVPMLITPNTSIGIAALASAVATVAGLLGPAYECSIVESHHSRKKDAPSGTALRLADAARRAGAKIGDDQVLAVRGGDVIGEHTVRFAGPGEYIELTHRATSRDLFALGALRAARWVVDRPPGWYSIEDVLGIGARSGHDRG